VNLQRVRPAAPPINSDESGQDAEVFREPLIETGAVPRSPTETQKLGSRLGTYYGGVTASTETVAARRHAGAHTPLIECKKHSCQHRTGLRSLIN
jgi:hypothetical protein